MARTSGDGLVNGVAGVVGVVGYPEQRAVGGGVGDHVEAAEVVHHRLRQVVGGEVEEGAEAGMGVIGHRGSSSRDAFVAGGDLAATSFDARPWLMAGWDGAHHSRSFLPDGQDSCHGDPELQAYVPIPEWDVLLSAAELNVTIQWGRGTGPPRRDRRRQEGRCDLHRCCGPERTHAGSSQPGLRDRQQLRLRARDVRVLIRSQH